MLRPFLIGVAGGSGSGKTYFLNRVMNQFSREEVCIISQDNYYLPVEAQTRDPNGVVNFDLPEGIDVERFIVDLAQLSAGQPVTIQEYTFNNPLRKPSAIEYIPAPIIMVEGIFIFHYEKLAPMFDLKIFLEAKDEMRLKRRLERDFTERGYDESDVKYRYEFHATPSYIKYIEPYKHEADVIFPNNAGIEKGLTMFTVYLRKLIEARKDHQ